jgi:hypothetical protein
MPDFVDEAFDETTFLVAMLVIGGRLLSRAQGGNHGLGAETEKGSALVGVVNLISDQHGRGRNRP